MHPQVLFPKTAQALHLLAAEPMVGDFYLSGGTIKQTVISAVKQYRF